MNPIINRLITNYELQPSFEPNGLMRADAAHLEAYPELTKWARTVPGLPMYIPPLIPTEPDWHHNAANMVHISFMHLVADIWTQLLVSKRDSKEKPLYLFWDDDIPKPTPLTALAWLLICEIWPYPSHHPTAGESGPVFVPTTFVLPQSTPLGFAGTVAHGYARSPDSDTGKRGLNGLFVESLNRDDRERMAKVASNHPAYRPKGMRVTSYGHHLDENYHREYVGQSQWPYTTNQRSDYGYGAHEISESRHSHNALHHLRIAVMKHVLTIPGFMTHRDNIHNVVGGSIRVFSEVGMILAKRDNSMLNWTPAGESVKLEHGVTIRQVPMHAPRVWFGFTKLGPDLNEPGNQDTASTRWAEAYIKHRPQAISMLMTPGNHDLSRLIDEATILRGSKLNRAGRLKHSTSTGGTGNAMRAAFEAMMNQSQNKTEK